MKTQAPTVRVLVTHALSLCKRSMTSRSKRVDFLKQFVHKLLSDAGRLMIMEGMWHHDDIASMLLCRSISLWLFFLCQPVSKAKGFGSWVYQNFCIQNRLPGATPDATIEASIQGAAMGSSCEEFGFCIHLTQLKHMSSLRKKINNLYDMIWFHYQLNLLPFTLTEIHD